MTDITAHGKNSVCETAVALGIFDGIHKGHRAVLERTKEAGSLKLAPAVFTFNTQSIRTKHDEPYQFIMSDKEKLQMLDETGMEYVCSPDFEILKEMSAEDFVRLVLIEKMKAKAVVCGPEFRFGKGAGCGCSELRQFGKKYGFEVLLVEPFIIDNIPVSSSYIKELIKNGDVAKAEEFLGRRPSVFGEVIHGNEIGRTIDFPTINQAFYENQVIPKFGVYVSETLVSGKSFRSVTNIGVKPTVENNGKPVCETHLLDFSGDLYGSTVRVTLLEYIRGECRFGSLDELKEQIGKDICAAKMCRRN